MRQKQPITKEEFDRLLAWLDMDSERAGEKYETIRRRLIDIFVYRGCSVAEDLADETINRVARKALEIADTYVGDPAHYFYGVAKRVHHEYLKRKPAAPPLPPPPPEDLEPQLACLDRCIEQLEPKSRELIILYYKEQKQAKIDARKELARRFNLNPSALRVRAHRIRDQLEKCVQGCLKEAENSK